jgi:hypothetical protein
LAGPAASIVARATCPDGTLRKRSELLAALIEPASDFILHHNIKLLHFLLKVNTFLRIDEVSVPNRAIPFLD